MERATTRSRGSKGADTIIGGDGGDLISADLAVNAAGTGLVAGTLETSANVLDGGAGDDTIFGANGADTIDGGSDADVLFGNGGSDIIRGGDGADMIDGGLGRDWLYGGAGNDKISVDVNDIAYGGADNDTIIGTVTTAQLFGEAGDDTIEVTANGASTISGGAGEDKITVSGTGGVYVTGDAGNDTITTSSGNDTVNGGSGANNVDLGAGDDTLIFVLRDKVLGTNPDKSFIYGGYDTVEAGIGTDTLRIEMILADFVNPDIRADVLELVLGWVVDGENKLAGSTFKNFEKAIVTVNGFTVLKSEPGTGGGGDGIYQSDIQSPAQVGATVNADTILFSQVAEFDESKIGKATDENGNLIPEYTKETWANKFTHLLADNDFVILGDVIKGEYKGPAFLKDKEVFGEDGNDTMIGLGAADRISGGKGSDLIWAGAGDDTIVGGTAGDGDNGRDTIDGGSGNDAISFVNGGQVIGGSGDDTITGLGMISNTRVTGDAGNDVITILKAGTGVSIEGGNGEDTITAYGGFGISATAGVTVDGGAGNDAIDTGLDRADVRANDTVRGGSGNDKVWTGDGQDYLDGGTGNDTLNGGDGNDLLVGGDGSDILYGEGGSDTFLFSRDIGYTTETVLFNSNSIDQYKVDLAAEGLRGSSDVFAGGEGGDTVLGTANNDYIRAYADNKVVLSDVEEVNGGAGNDLIDMRGYLGSDIVIKGGVGNDVLIGSDQADWLHGEKGNDTMAGGGGDDVFVFSAVNLSAGETNRDVIVDFAKGDHLFIAAGTLEEISYTAAGDSIIFGNFGMASEFKITVKNYLITSDDFLISTGSCIPGSPGHLD